MPGWKRPVRIAVVGIDGTGKSSAVEHLKKILGEKYRVEHITTVPRKETAKTDLGKKVFGFLERIRKKADKSKDKAYISIAQLMYNRIFPFVRIAKESKADVIIYERHPLIDYAVYGKEYLGRPLTLIEKAFSGTTKPDIILYLDVDPKKAFSRIVKRQKVNERKKHLHPHEDSVEKLSVAKSRFDKVISRFERDPKVSVIRINANQPLEAMLKEIEEKIKKTMGLD